MRSLDFIYRTTIYRAIHTLYIIYIKHYMRVYIERLYIERHEYSELYIQSAIDI
jgi:hypothetical protein